MSHRGELGPLDVQLRQEDELMRSSSGLNISMAINSLKSDTLNIWVTQLLSIVAQTSGAITTKTATEIATSLTVGLLSPITAQIDPLKLGEVQRAMEIATQYGVRLGARLGTVRQLVNGYPSHSFVIDFEEASRLFPDVRRPTLVEIELELTLRTSFYNAYQTECIRMPHPKGVVVYQESQKEAQYDLQPTPPAPEEEDRE